MKKAIFLLISLFLVSIIGCSTSESTVETDDLGVSRTSAENSVQNQPDSFRNIVDFLHRVPGINITGPSSNPTITIRGISSLISGIEPLYVVDGLAVGTNYSMVNGMINVRDIDNIKVLKGSETSIYGARGANGVILITTKGQQ